MSDRPPTPDDVPVVREAGALLEEAAASWPEWLAIAGTLTAALLVGLVLGEIVLFVAAQAARRTRFSGDEHVVRRLRAPMRVVLPLLAALVVRPALELSGGTDEILRRALAIGLIGAATWLVIRAVNAGVYVILQQHRTDVADNLEARRVHTQLRILARIVAVVVTIIGAAAMLMTFPSIKQLGTSLLASAGIAGLIVGLAAQKTIGNLLAGLQIALTRPIHLDDVVIIDGEWGRIEEITTTYVVVRIWDERRLIVPFTRIIDQPFQNWTRQTADLLGTVFLHADYTVPVDELRAEVRRLAEASERWDGRVAQLVVTGAGERTLELRALVSAADSGKAWDLRCEVREGLVAWLQAHHPECLPRLRASVDDAREQAGSER